MRKPILAISLLLASIISQSQTTLHLRIGTGLFTFRGDDAVKNQTATAYNTMEGGLYTKPYGKKAGSSLTIGAVAKRVSHSRFLYGAALEFQSLAASSNIDTVHFIYSSYYPNMIPTNSGKSVFRGSYASFAPFVGRRLRNGNHNIDLYAGPELAFIVDKQVHDTYKTTLVNYDSKKRPDPRIVDFRLQAGIDLNLDRLLFNIGYARGMLNYYKQYTGGQPKAYSNFIRIGVGYRL